jgi:hypothetical protein
MRAKVVFQPPRVAVPVVCVPLARCFSEGSFDAIWAAL